MAITGVGSGGDVCIDVAKQQIMRRDGSIIEKHEVLTLDGASGVVYQGALKLITAVYDEDYMTVMAWANENKRLLVYADAETFEGVKKAFELGAEGIGLMRTEQMFLSDFDRLNAMRAMILADTKEERMIQLASLLDFQREDFLDVFRHCRGKVLKFMISSVNSFSLTVT